MPNQFKRIYKIYHDNEDQFLTLKQLSQLVAQGKIKPDARIYSAENKCWVDFKDHKLAYLIETPQNDEINKENKEPKFNLLAANQPLLISCLNCNHSYSKRAEKCPKCGSTVTAACAICKSIIPKNAEVCSECGDPDPFMASSSKGATSEMYTQFNTSTSKQSAIESKNGQQNIATSISRKAPIKGFSWRSLIISFIVASILNVLVAEAVGTSPRINIVWTVFWIYLTLESWKVWKWKALLPYPLFIATYVLMSIILVSQGTTDTLTDFLILGGCNFLGLLCFGMFLEKGKKIIKQTINQDHCSISIEPDD